jgi:DNA-binding GntR family transcriptional regulator
MVRFERNRGVRVLQTMLHDLEEVFALRLLPEVPATRRACRQIDETGRRELRKLYQAMEKAARTDDEYRMWEHDRRFHLVLLQASGNLRLAEYVDGLPTSWPSTARCSPTSSPVTSTGRPRRWGHTCCAPQSSSSRRRREHHPEASTLTWAGRGTPDKSTSRNTLTR